MKRRNLYVMGLLAATSLCISGFEKFVDTPVVAERTTEAEEGTSGEAVLQEPDESDGAGNAEGGAIDLNTASPGNFGSVKTVAEQIAAPERYVTDFQEINQVTLEDGTVLEQTVTVTADAEIKIPDVDTITLKRVNRILISDEQIEEWNSVLVGEAVTMEYEEGMLYAFGEGEQSSFPYSVQHGRRQNFDNSEAYLTEVYLAGISSSNLDWGEQGLYNRLTGELLEEPVRKSVDEYETDVTELLETLNFGDFAAADAKESQIMYYQAGWGDHSLPVTTFSLERIVDGVPVTVLDSNAMPIQNMDVDTVQTEGVVGLKWWLPEYLEIGFMGDQMESFYYPAPLEIKDYSDEPLYLLPFEEIYQIFEQMIADRMTGQWRNNNAGYTEPIIENGEAIYRVATQYPYHPCEKVNVTIHKVKLGYMRTSNEGSLSEGMLIPVWDFIGTWEMENAVDPDSGYALDMLLSNTSLFTIDARDGSVIQRTLGA